MSYLLYVGCPRMGQLDFKSILELSINPALTDWNFSKLLVTRMQRMANDPGADTPGLSKAKTLHASQIKARTSLLST